MTRPISTIQSACSHCGSTAVRFDEHNERRHEGTARLIPIKRTIRPKEVTDAEAN